MQIYDFRDPRDVVIVPFQRCLNSADILMRPTMACVNVAYHCYDGGFLIELVCAYC